MRWAAVIGSPIEHSLSPFMHRLFWESMGLSDWEYRRCEVTAETLPAWMAALDEQCAGVSVTMPCKQALIPLLDACDPLAQAVGSVNTLIPSGGVLTGFNTDVYGMTEAIERVRGERGLCAPVTAVIMGSGATAASALAAVGSLGVRSISVAARAFAPARGGAPALARVAHALGISYTGVNIENDAEWVPLCEAADVVISTLPAGVLTDLPAMRIRPEQTLLDVVYAPRRTALVSAWESAGGSLAHGLDMLLYQGAMQARLMTGRDVSDDVLRRVRRAMDDAVA